MRLLCPTKVQREIFHFGNMRNVYCVSPLALMCVISFLLSTIELSMQIYNTKSVKFLQSRINASDIVWSAIKSINIWFKIILLIQCDLFHDFPFQYRVACAQFMCVTNTIKMWIRCKKNTRPLFFQLIVKSLYFMFSIFTQLSLSYSVRSK